jgi:hypothetical protein
VVVQDVIFNPPAECLQQRIKSLDLSFQLHDLVGPVLVVPPFLVHAFPAMACAPRTCRLCTIAFHLPSLAELA